MPQADTSGLNEGLFYEDTLPLSWQEVGNAVTAARLLSISHSNEQLLRYLAATGEHRADPADDGHAQSSQELSRLEAKVNLLLNMVGQLLSQNIALPEAVPLRISADRLQWNSRHPAKTGAQLSVELYLAPRYPSALTLFGMVEKVTNRDGGYLIDMTYINMSEGLRNALEKMIFRHHRRRIAHARQPSKR